MSASEVMEYIDKETAKNGIYNFAVNKYIDRKDGHIMCLIKNEGKPYLFDVQAGKKVTIEDILSLTKFEITEKKQIGVELLRIDKLVLSDDAIKVLSSL